MKLKFKWNIRNTTGLIIGVVSPLLISPLVVLLVSKRQNYPFNVLWTRFMYEAPMQSKIISLAIITNLIWFYIFLNRERWELAKGVVIGSAAFLPFIAYVTLFR